MCYKSRFVGLYVMVILLFSLSLLHSFSFSFPFSFFFFPSTLFYFILIIFVGYASILDYIHRTGPSSIYLPDYTDQDRYGSVHSIYHLFSYAAYIHTYMNQKEEEKKALG